MSQSRLEYSSENVNNWVSEMKKMSQWWGCVIIYSLLLSRPLLVLFEPKSALSHLTLPKSAIILAKFLNRQPWFLFCFWQNQCSQSQLLETYVTVCPSYQNLDIFCINQAITQESIYDWIFSVY